MKLKTYNMKKHYIKKLFATVAVLLCSVTANAHDFEVDGIYYSITSSSKKTVYVTYKGKKDYSSFSDDYSGDVIIPESITYNGITYSVTGIVGYTFTNCNNLQSVTIPSSMTAIGNDAFNTCRSIKSVTIPNSVTSIGDWAFIDCNSLTSITIPNSVTTIGDHAFTRCSSLASIKIPNSVTRIEEAAFAECTSLESIEIPNGVTSIERNAFYGCESLTSVTIPNSVTTIGERAFYGCSSLASVTILNSVTSIGIWAFYGCSSLTNITIPNSVTSIGESAFYGCSSLATATIGSGVSSIGRDAFYCNNLYDVYCFATTPPSIESDVFASYRKVTLHVPAEAINDYKTIEPWSSFKNIKTIENIETPVCATPQISYSNGRLSIDCKTQAAVFITKITSNDFCEFNNKNIDLSATYNISVYAVATNHKNSETVNATLCWIEIGDSENDTTGIINIPATAALITSNNGTITVNCSLNGEAVAVYTTGGVLVSTTTIENGSATIATGLSKGTITIIKIGKKSVKVII